MFVLDQTTKFCIFLNLSFLISKYNIRA